jgi:predicted dithiol-disulfide oxidoreductase (DUF899 family)
MTTATIETTRAKAVTHAEWIAARKQFLAKEKEFTHLRDELSKQRRELPWETVEKKNARTPQPLYRFRVCAAF